MIKIKLKGKGVDYNKYVDKYFDDFAMDGFPYFLGGKGQYDGKEIVLLDQLEAKPQNTKVMVLDGKDFFYYFSGHVLSGKLKTVTLATLGNSYDKKTGGFKTDKKGLIKDVSASVEISGLKISNPKKSEGDLHDVVYALMGGAHEGGGTSDPSVLFGFVDAQGHKVTGTKGNDSYVGTDRADQVNLGKGNDKLNGGLGKDKLTGGKGKDTFIFNTELGPNNVDKIKDFKPKDDTIKLAKSVFDGLSKGKLDSDAFVKGTAAKDAEDRIIYDKKTGKLFFDADGSGTDAAAIKFATVSKNLKITADDFLVF